MASAPSHRPGFAEASLTNSWPVSQLDFREMLFVSAPPASFPSWNGIFFPALKCGLITALSQGNSREGTEQRVPRRASSRNTAGWRACVAAPDLFSKCEEGAGGPPELCLGQLVLGGSNTKGSQC